MSSPTAVMTVLSRGCGRAIVASTASADDQARLEARVGDADALR